MTPVTAPGVGTCQLCGMMRLFPLLPACGLAGVLAVAPGCADGSGPSAGGHPTAVASDVHAGRQSPVNVVTRRAAEDGDTVSLRLRCADRVEAVALLPDGRPVAIMDDGRLITTDMDGNRVIVPEALWERPPTRSRPRPDTAVAMAALPARDDGQQRVVVYGHHLPAPVVRTV